MSEAQRVYIVDDDEAVRQSLTLALTVSGFTVFGWQNGAEFLSQIGNLKPGCVVLDLRMPDLSGFDVFERSRRNRRHWPVIFMSGHGDVASAVQAMRHGAVSFLEKPVCNAELFDLITETARLQGNEHARTMRRVAARERLERLTDREREILCDLLDGLRNKEIAAAHNISPRTVEAHRANMMQKVEVQNLTELLLLAVEASEQRVC